MPKAKGSPVAVTGTASICKRLVLVKQLEEAILARSNSK